MKHILTAIAALSLAAAAYANDITLKTGKVYKDIEIQGLDAKGISIYYDGQKMLATINPDQISDTDAKKYEFQINEYRKLKVASDKAVAKAKLDEMLKKNGVLLDGNISQVVGDAAALHIGDPQNHKAIYQQTIYISDIPIDDLTDGVYFGGNIYRVGTYQYTNTMGAMKTIPAYTASKKQAIEYYKAQLFADNVGQIATDYRNQQR